MPRIWQARRPHSSGQSEAVLETQWSVPGSCTLQETLVPKMSQVWMNREWLCHQGETRVVCTPASPGMATAGPAGLCVGPLSALSSELGRGVRRSTQHCGPTVAHLGDCRRVAQPPRLGLPAWLWGPALGAALSHHPAVAGSFWAAS